MIVKETGSPSEPPLPQLTGQVKQKVDTAKQERLLAVSFFLPIAISSFTSVLLIIRSFSTANRLRANLIFIGGNALLITSIILTLIYVLVIMPAQQQNKQRKENTA